MHEKARQKPAQEGYLISRHAYLDTTVAELQEHKYDHHSLDEAGKHGALSSFGPVFLSQVQLV